MNNAEYRLACERYPNIRTAIAYVELILCGPKSVISLIRDAVPPASFDEALEMVKETCRYSIRITPDDEVGNMPEALEQMDHPEFKTYLCGKLGMM